MDGCGDTAWAQSNLMKGKFKCLHLSKISSCFSVSHCSGLVLTAVLRRKPPGQKPMRLRFQRQRSDHGAQSSRQPNREPLETDLQQRSRVHHKPNTANTGAKPLRRAARSTLLPTAEAGNTCRTERAADQGRVTNSQTSRIEQLQRQRPFRQQRPRNRQVRQDHANNVRNAAKPPSWRIATEPVSVRCRGITAGRSPVWIRSAGLAALKATNPAEYNRRMTI
jgi:hypothetical protein